MEAPESRRYICHFVSCRVQGHTEELNDFLNWSQIGETLGIYGILTFSIINIEYNIIVTLLFQKIEFKNVLRLWEHAKYSVGNAI